jgi:hypothetical protein
VTGRAAATPYRRRPEVLWRRSLDAVVLLPPGVAEPVTLAGTGPELWELLAEAHTLEDLAATLGTRHEADPGVVHADLEPIVARLVDAGAVERVPDGDDDPAAGRVVRPG